MNNLWMVTKEIIAFIFGHPFIWNMFFAVIIVFFERRDPKSVWAWLLLLFFMPGVGFLFYLFLGRGMRKRKMFRRGEMEDCLSEAVRKQEDQFKTRKSWRQDEDLDDFTDLVMYNLATSDAVLSDDNDVDILIDGNEKFDALIKDIRSAKRFIHMQYYIIRDDVLFHRIAEALTEKVNQGVEVRILYDAMGCRKVRRGFWRRLNASGVRTAEFFPAILSRFQPRVNYRNHRKIVVIDNRVAYVGGFNVGKEYIGLSSRFGYWRDTHLRIRGSAVTGLQLRFILDWNYASGENLLQEKMLFGGVRPGTRDFCKAQVISSGPNHASEHIRDNYLRLISKAKRSIYIQTPYFIPDEAIFNALKIAVRSGIEVYIMIPCMPDHPFVYWATYSYVGDLVMAGAKCYTYEKGFLHCKGLIVDGKVFCCGTANMDIRSFALNFEVNVVVYNSEKASEMEQIFHRDLKNCNQITKDKYAERKLFVRFREQMCRLMSPIL